MSERFVFTQRLFVSLFLLLAGATTAIAQPITLTDYRGNAIEFPQGTQSFADSILFARVGSPSPVELKVPSAALGLPDWNVPDTQRSNFPNLAYSLGCRGKLALQFEDNALIDVEGPDLFVFEVGANVEPAMIYVSNDGTKWESVGRIGGAFSTVDLADHNLQSRSYRYVMIEDAGGTCTGITPGADIDAVGAIGSAARLTLAGEVLFDVGKSDLKPATVNSLAAIAAKLASENAKLVEVVGHTDSAGSNEANFALGSRRAQSVADYLVGQETSLRNILSVASRGETEPTATNGTQAGRARNRRVEITVYFDR
ncbi:MAG: OmpA family protein [Pseudomonadota bacterium]